MHSVFESYKKSLGRLREILQAEATPANKDSAIQRFELTYELAWKSVQRYLREKDVVARTPRDAFVEAFSAGLIDDDPGWIEMGRDRNITSHTYNEQLADEIYGRISRHFKLFEKLEKALE